MDIQNLTLGELADLYDRSTPEEKQWLHDNISQWGKEKPTRRSNLMGGIKNYY